MAKAEIVTEEILKQAIQTYSQLPTDILGAMTSTGMNSEDWEIKEAEPEAPRDTTKLTQEELKKQYDVFAWWFRALSNRIIIADAHCRAAKKNRKYIEAYLRLLYKSAEEASDLTAEEKKLAVLVHPDFVRYDAEEERWRGIVTNLETRLANVAQLRDRVFREDRSRDNIGSKDHMFPRSRLNVDEE